MNFELVLAEGKIKPQQITALHLMSAFAIIGTGAVFYFFSMYLKWWGAGLLAGGIILLLLTIARNKWMMKPEVNRVFRIVELMAALCIASYCAMNAMWVPTAMFAILSIVIIMAFAWERGSGEQYIYISKEGIKLPFSSRKRFIEWRDVDNVMYRYGTLTVETGENKLYQWNIRKARFEREPFERFCAEQAAQHKEKRVAEW